LFTSALLNDSTISKPFNATVDFGYPLIAIPKTTFLQKILHYLNQFSECYESDAHVWHCEFKSLDDVNKMPYLILQAANFSYAMHWSNYTYQNGKIVYLLFTVHDKNEWIIGSPFLANLYTVYDYGASLVGFAMYTIKQIARFGILSLSLGSHYNIHICWSGADISRNTHKLWH